MLLCSFNEVTKRVARDVLKAWVGGAFWHRIQPAHMKNLLTKNRCILTLCRSLNQITVTIRKGLAFGAMQPILFHR